MVGPLKNEEFKEFLTAPIMLKALALVNLMGAGYGFYYYSEQFATTAKALWIFVPDSPTSVLAAAAFFYLLSYGSRNSLIGNFAFFANLKYGIWTVFVLLFYFETFYYQNTLGMYLFLLVSHALMALQAYFMMDLTDFTRRSVIAVSSWFILNDLVDYLLDTHTRLFTPHAHPLNPAAVVAVTLTFVCIVLSYRKYAGEK